ncbi:class I SAM-dependent methyltransferase [Mesorhizobium sp. M0913]|uniref:class I SAM-dependent methyltransferase n=1 Tax=Mesorhizobium sp. M0913 TaxID=2957026 RepID=UPI0033357BEA
MCEAGDQEFGIVFVRTIFFIKWLAKQSILGCDQLRLGAEFMRNSSRTWLRRANEEFAATVPIGSRVLDAGAGDQPYRHLFAHCEYEAADFELVDKVYAKSTYVCNLEEIPVEDARFDIIIFNQVMEHLIHPMLVLHELRRVLKPGGRMICSAPLFYEEHEQPYDFYRYTKFAWRAMMNEAGFDLLSVEWLEGYFGTVAYQLATAAKYLPSRTYRTIPGLLGWYAVPVVVFSRLLFNVLAKIFYFFDERGKHTSSGYPKNYVVTVRKPSLAVSTEI